VGEEGGERVSYYINKKKGFNKLKTVFVALMLIIFLAKKREELVVENTTM
jgi:hypothetical protein